MKKDKYFIQNEDYEWDQIDPEIADNVLRQYFERRYIGAITLSAFVIGFLLGVLAYAL